MPRGAEDVHYQLECPIEICFFPKRLKRFSDSLVLFDPSKEMVIYSVGFERKTLN